MLLLYKFIVGSFVFKALKIKREPKNFLTWLEPQISTYIKVKLNIRKKNDMLMKNISFF